MDGDVLAFAQADRSQIALVGGKGASLGELARIPGVRVPDGFCVTTGAFRRVVAAVPRLEERLERLAHLDSADSDALRTLNAEIRSMIEQATIPGNLAGAITTALTELGEHDAYAVRSSATAEDLPTASFAGQQDSYLNVIGRDQILTHILRCWASLFTDRAVTYRVRSGFDQSRVAMAVVVQRMVTPLASGVMFTADPITSHRTVVVIEAAWGLGEALVSGHVNPDTYTVADGAITGRQISAKAVAVRASVSGGTCTEEIDPAQQRQPALTEAQILDLAALGRTIEHSFGHPQDIEWCLDADGFQIVQSRPITTLFPIPDAGDNENHVFISVGHAQMMTDAMRPLGISFWQMTTPRPMYVAGGRLFVDVAPDLRSPARRDALLAIFLKSDPLVGDAVQRIVDRGDVIPAAESGEASTPPPGAGAPGPPVQQELETDPAIVTELIAQTQASLATLKEEIRSKRGVELLDFIAGDIAELKRLLTDRRSYQVFSSAMDASSWLNDHLREWLGETNVADTLTLSVPHNITSEMGLALMDVADVIRERPEVVAFLETAEGDDFLRELIGVPAGTEARDAILGFLEMYGMRCVGEIDITRPRWSEHPSTLLPLILGNVANFAPGAGRQRFEQGHREASAKEQDVLTRLRELPDGDQKADETKRKIDRVRTFIGYREYPKYGMVSRYFIYKQSLLQEAERLVEAGAVREKEDVFYLTFDELRDVIGTGHADNALIAERKEAFTSYQTLTPPRVFTSDGEVVLGTYRREDVPADALVGLAVSAGLVEGRARVIHDIADARLDPSDILVTAYTDPSWTPLFVGIRGLVTEVGGLMTHGAVIAREYGLPAVVGVENATRLIRDGQRIRVDGTNGFVEILA